MERISLTVHNSHYGHFYNIGARIATAYSGLSRAFSPTVMQRFPKWIQLVAETLRAPAGGGPLRG